MANPNIPGQGRVAQNLPSPPNASSPASGGSTPLSYRPNVNRAKTKRWVEAKQYSYDGGDWGDEDDEDEEEEEPAPAPVSRPPYGTQRTGSSSELSSRRLSGLMSGAENEPRGSPTVDTSARPPPEATQNAPMMGLPDIKRMSSFGTDFMGGHSSNQPNNVESQQPSLQHNPSQASQASTASQGFTSVVHQAFDVPETPDSTTGSVARSNSDGTSVISPIMSNRGPYDDRTPTIPEEPAESSTPTATSNNSPPLILGHRRDLSLPERDNSPSKQPTITEHEAPSGGQAELSTVSPGQPQLPQESPQEASPDTPGKDFVAPLKLGERKQSEQLGTTGYQGNIPTITTPNANDSPHDTNSEQLREEIMRSLSRENSQEPEEIPQTHTGDSKTESIPYQYEKYWDGQTGPNPDEAPKPLVSESHPDWTANHPLGSQDPYATTRPSNEPTLVTDEAPQKPRLGRRFSWESSSSTTEPGPQAHPVNLEPVPLADGVDNAARAPEAVEEQLPSYDSEGSGSQRIEKPRLSIVPPIPENTTPPVQVMGPVDGPNNENNVTVTDTSGVGTGSVDEAKLQSFRSILNLTNPNQRTKAFDSTRDQFASINTGLNRWLQITFHENPQHADLLHSSQNMSAIPRNSPSRARFPKLTSLGNLGTPTEGTPTSASHLRRPSGNIGTIMNKSNVEQRGKEFVHTAGKFGGKAGEAAKGLFAKGRSKFRASGDKGQSSTSRRKSLHFTFSPESNGSQSYSSSRNSINLGSLPVFKFGQKQTGPSTQADSNYDRTDEPSGKRLKPTGSMDISRLQMNSEDTSNRAVSQPLPNSSDEDRIQKETARKSGIVGDLEREMIAALGLSPTKSQPAQADLASSSNKAPEQSPNLTKPPLSPSKDVVVPIQAKESSDNQRLSKEKSLPVLPTLESDSPHSLAPVDPTSPQPATETTPAPFTSIRPVVEVEPSSPPKTPPKDAAPEDAPPPTPPKDTAHLNAGKAAKSRHNARQPSVSTLGIEDRHISDQADDEFNNTPPSPIQPPSPEAAEPNPDPVYDKPLPEARTSSSSLPSVEDNSSGLEHTFPPRPATSAEVLDSKRKSISGLPPSTPNFTSPLRNEVRYSPATRSSMLSFGSWGRQSNNSKGTRPPTPANELSPRVESNSSAQNGESKMEKLKGFGRRRRASVGDLLSGIQGGFQGLQEKIHQQEPQENGQQRKRTFNRISSFFTRSDSEPSEGFKFSNTGPMANTPAHEDLAGRSLDDRSWASASPKARKILGDKDLFEPASDVSASTPGLSSDASPDRRASVELPPTATPSALASGRFYSQVGSADSLPKPQHTRVKSLPLSTQMSQPLSPIPHSPSENSGSTKSEGGGLDNRLSEENQHANSAAQNGLSKDPAPNGTSQLPADNQSIQPNLKPNHDILSRKSLHTESSTTATLEPRDTAVSGMSHMTLSEHPHRDETQALTRNSEPVELALKDDSSEEIVMSPTAYPGQEWMPMQC